MSRRALRIATRGSPLALFQANAVAARLGADTEIVVIKTEGDRNTSDPLHALGGRGVFTTEVQAAVIDGRADIAVHSAKDLPSAVELTPDELVLACVPERADPRDCLIGSSLADLPEGATVGTGSIRRQVLLAGLRPDLRFAELRGNIATRLARIGELPAIVGAIAALTRLNLSEFIAEALDLNVFVPQVGQGALAVECRADDDATRAALAAIDDLAAHTAVRAERAFLAAMGGGCDVPIGAHAYAEAGRLRLTAFVHDDRGSRWHTDVGDDPVALGAAVAARYLEPDA